MAKLDLDIGGSSGSTKGNFFELHFASILQSLGYKIIKISEDKKEKKYDQDEFGTDILEQGI